MFARQEIPIQKAKTAEDEAKLPFGKFDPSSTTNKIKLSCTQVLYLQGKLDRVFLAMIVLDTRTVGGPGGEIPLQRNSGFAAEVPSTTFVYK